MGTDGSGVNGLTNLIIDGGKAEGWGKEWGGGWGGHCGSTG